MANDPYADRKSITFEQAEGVEPLPSQLKLRELSPELRAMLWDHFYYLIVDERTYTGMILGNQWSIILRDEHVFRQFGMVDEFSESAAKNINRLKNIFKDGTYIEVFGFIQFVMRHPACFPPICENVAALLALGRAAYTVIENTIVPISSAEEAESVRSAIANVSASELNGAKQHLLNAASCLTTGDSAASIRESISAVESVAKILAPQGDFGDALNQIEKGGHIHGAMKDAFKKLYGYTSDEKGIRHSLLLEGQAQADDIDAQFMLGACASFVSYLVNKARAAGLLANK